MKNLSSRKISTLVLVACLIISAKCIDLSLNVIDNDVVSYDINYLNSAPASSSMLSSQDSNLSAQQLTQDIEPDNYSADAPYAVLSAIKEVNFADIVGTDSNNASYGIFRQDAQQLNQALYVVGPIRLFKLNVENDKITTREQVAEVNQSEFKSVTMKDDYSIITRGRASDTDYILDLLLYKGPNFTGTP